VRDERLGRDRLNRAGRGQELTFAKEETIAEIFRKRSALPSWRVSAKLPTRRFYFPRLVAPIRVNQPFRIRMDVRYIRAVMR